MANDYRKILKILPGVKENVLLEKYTTYKIGGPAKYFFIADNKESLLKALKAAKELKLPIFILGGGSNLLISDKGFKGLAIKIDISDTNFKGPKALVGAGASLTKLAYLSADNGLSGLEWAAGIPGTVGGAIYGSAQAFGTKISEAVEAVESINLKTLELKNFTKEQCKFSLKNSIFKESKNWVIVSAVLGFKKSDVQEIKNRIAEFLEYRKTRHPIDFPSAGSTFVNPEIHPVKYRKAVISASPKLFDRVKIKKLYKKYPELEGFVEKGFIPAGYLIAKSGLAGKKIGKAQFSERHSNFIVNLGDAKAKDVLSLINLAKKKVKNNFNISLEPEVQFVGFDKK